MNNGEVKPWVLVLVAGLLLGLILSTMRLSIAVRELQDKVDALPHHTTK